MALETDDPFTFLHQHLWSVFTGYAPWAALVRAGNRMRFDEKPYPGKLELNLQPGDTPLVMLTPEGFRWRPFHFDTSALDMDLTFVLRILGENLKTTPVDALKWQSARALVNAGIYLGVPYLVRGVQVRNGSDDLLTPSEWKKGHSRMMTVLAIDINATITKTAVLAGEYPTSTPT